MQEMDTAAQNALINYYLLCTVATGKRVHIVEQVKNNLTGIINKKEMEVYFRIQNGVLVPKEIVIGGNEASNCAGVIADKTTISGHAIHTNHKGVYECIVIE